MPFIVSEGSSFVPCPAGQHSAVCVDVVDLGRRPNPFPDAKMPTIHQCRLVWQIDKTRDDGKPYLIQKTYTASLHEKANLRKDLEAWRGKPFTRAEAQGFDVEVLLGKCCLLQATHVERNGTTYANVTSIMRLPAGMPIVTPSGYVRVKDRTDAHDPQVPPDDAYGMPDDEIPF